jgi:hypothetical protein
VPVGLGVGCCLMCLCFPVGGARRLLRIQVFGFYLKAAMSKASPFGCAARGSVKNCLERACFASPL